MSQANETADVAIVGCGPAGAALATRLADRGLHVIVLERRAEPTWHASGVFSSPVTRERLLDLGFSRSDIARLNRPISALNLETTRGVTCRIEYERGYACGFDRTSLEGMLRERARSAGADVRPATVVRSVRLPEGRQRAAALTVSPAGATSAGETRSVEARLVVGADGMSSLVARTAGVYRRGPFERSGITFHRRDPDAARALEPMEGRFVFGRRWYVGVAPVPGERVNVGIVVPSAALGAGRAPAHVAERLIAAFPEPRAAWMHAATADSVTVAGRLQHRVSRASGRGFALVGDAIGFIDPLTGEGIQRALLSGELAADAITKVLQGDLSALEEYDRRVRRTFYPKNLVSWILQAFLAHPQLFDYTLRRLARRQRRRQELTLVLTDQWPATRVLDPRYLARLLAP